jgi:hypothetical protein
MVTAPARARFVTSRARTLRSHVPVPKRSSLAGSRAMTTSEGLAAGVRVRSHRPYTEDSSAPVLDPSSVQMTVAASVDASPMIAAGRTVRDRASVKSVAVVLV